MGACTTASTILPGGDLGQGRAEEYRRLAGQRWPELPQTTLDCLIWRYGTLIEDTASGPVTTRVPTQPGDYAEFYRRAAAAARGVAPEPVPTAEAVAVVNVLEQATRQQRHEF